MSPKVWMDYMFDHTTIIAEDDPELDRFIEMDSTGLIQLRILPATGAEKFAEYLFNKIGNFVFIETNGRVKVKQVEFREHGKIAQYMDTNKVKERMWLKDNPGRTSGL